MPRISLAIRFLCAWLTMGVCFLQFLPGMLACLPLLQCGFQIAPLLVDLNAAQFEVVFFGLALVSLADPLFDSTKTRELLESISGRSIEEIEVHP